MEVYIEKMMEQLNSGESKTIFRNISRIVLIGLTTGGRKAWQEEEETRKRYQYCSDSSGVILYLRALQGHSGRSLVDPTLQVNVVIPSNFCQCIYHVGCAINFTLQHLFGIDTWKQTDSILSAFWIPWTKIKRILIRST